METRKSEFGPQRLKLQIKLIKALLAIRDISLEESPILTETEREQLNSAMDSVSKVVAALQYPLIDLGKPSFIVKNWGGE